MSEITAQPRLRGDPVLRAQYRFARGDASRLSTAAWTVIAVWVAVTAVDLLLRPALILSGQPATALPSLPLASVLAWTFLAVPAGLYLYFWLPRSFASLLPDLISRGLISGPRTTSGSDSIGAFVDEAAARLDQPIWIVPTVVLIVWYWLLKVSEVPPHAIPGARPQVVLDLIASTRLIYASTLTFLRLIAAITITADLFDRYDVRVYPHHPDGAGGFSPLGNRISILARAGVLAGTAAFVINFLWFRVGNDLSRSPETILTVTALLVLAPLITWSWLRGPHQAMLAARGQVLDDVSKEFDRIARRALPGGADDGTIQADLKSGTDLLVELDHRRSEIVQAYPTWPIHTSELRTLSATVATPLVAGLIAIAVAVLRQLMGAG